MLETEKTIKLRLDYINSAIRIMRVMSAPSMSGFTIKDNDAAREVYNKEAPKINSVGSELVKGNAIPPNFARELMMLLTPPPLTDYLSQEDVDFLNDFTNKRWSPKRMVTLSNNPSAASRMHKQLVTIAEKLSIRDGVGEPKTQGTKHFAVKVDDNAWFSILYMTDKFLGEKSDLRDRLSLALGMVGVDAVKHDYNVHRLPKQFEYGPDVGESKTEAEPKEEKPKPPAEKKHTDTVKKKNVLKKEPKKKFAEATKPPVIDVSFDYDEVLAFKNSRRQTLHESSARNILGATSAAGVIDPDSTKIAWGINVKNLGFEEADNDEYFGLTPVSNSTEKRGKTGPCYVNREVIIEVIKGLTPKKALHNKLRNVVGMDEADSKISFLSKDEEFLVSGFRGRSSAVNAMQYFKDALNVKDVTLAEVNNQKGIYKLTFRDWDEMLFVQRGFLNLQKAEATKINDWLKKYSITAEDVPEFDMLKERAASAIEKQ